MHQGSGTLSSSRPVPGSVPALARGVELLGAVEGSGYRRAPSLARRADGQLVQLSPVLYAVLSAIDGRRDAAALAAAIEAEHGLAVEPDDLADLISAKLRPLGLLRGADGAEPIVARANPLLALRGRLVISKPELTERLARPFVWLFHPAVVTVVLVGWVAGLRWLAVERGLAGAARQVLYEPGLVLGVLGLTALSAGFHEVGHAAACLRGGAKPGVMGAGLYLVWPAFYTDVSDSYRLPRGARLRVDLGGLYFNAVFSLAVLGLWALTGIEALLIIVPLELVAMLRQLVPFVRFDGYHVLADLTGVPDLFARIKPTLRGLLPWHWHDPESRALKPWARAVVVLWVVTVLPALGFSLVLLVLALPRLVATSWDSLGLQVDSLSRSWGSGQLLSIVLGVVSILAALLPVLSITYFLTRLTRRAGQKVWRATEGNPRQRAAAVLGGLLLLGALGAVWWPDGQYEPIREDERGTVLEAMPAVGRLVGVASDAPAVPATDGTDGPPSVTAATGTTIAAIDHAPAGIVAGPGPVRERWTFTPPEPPGEGDNQALAVNYEDGSELYAYEASFDVVTSEAVLSRNQAYALASCAGCRTEAVAFQVVLVVGQVDEIGPRNEAVAVNRSCDACTTRALAMQTILSVPEAPTPEQEVQLEALWARVEAVRGAVGTASIGELRARLSGLQGEIAAVLGAEVIDGDAAVDADDTPAADTTTSTTMPDGTTTSQPEPTTTSTEPLATTTTTAPSTTTTTTEPPTTTTTTPPASEPTGTP